MKKWKENFLKSSFDRKMQFIVTSTVIITTALVLLISTVSSVTSMKERSLEMLQSQNETIVENFHDSLENYRTLARAVVLDSAVQEYAKDKGESSAEKAILSQNALNNLESISNMYSNLNFIALVRDGRGDYLYAGKASITVTRFLQSYAQDALSCKMVRQGTIRMGWNNAYYGGNK